MSDAEDQVDRVVAPPPGAAPAPRAVPDAVPGAEEAAPERVSPGLLVVIEKAYELRDSQWRAILEGLAGINPDWAPALNHAIKVFEEIDARIPRPGSGPAPPEEGRWQGNGLD